MYRELRPCREALGTQPEKLRSHAKHCPFLEVGRPDNTCVQSSRFLLHKRNINLNRLFQDNTKTPVLQCLINAAAAKSLQSCPTLCDPIDSSPPGSPIPGILQARTLVWVAISFSNAWKWKVKVKSPSRVWLLATPRTAAYQAPLSMGFSRREYWSGLPLPSPMLMPNKC